MFTIGLGSIALRSLYGHLMSRPPESSALPASGLGLPAFGRSLLVVDAKHPVGQLGQLMRVRDPEPVRRAGWWPPWRSA